MKPLSQHIQETFNIEFSKEVFVEKPIGEDLADLMRTSPAKEGGTMKGIILKAKQEEK